MSKSFNFLVKEGDKIRVVVDGNLTMDPPAVVDAKGHKLLKTPQDSKNSFSVAVNGVDLKYLYLKAKGELPEGAKYNSDENTFVRLVAWNQTAQFMADNMFKGQHIIVGGELRSFESKKTPGKLYFELIVEQVKPLTWKNKGETPDSSNVPEDTQGFDEVEDDEEIPF